MSAIYVGICRWISLAAASADPVATTTIKETFNVEDAVNYYYGINVITTMQFVLHSFVAVIQIERIKSHNIIR